VHRLPLTFLLGPRSAQGHRKLPRRRLAATALLLLATACGPSLRAAVTLHLESTPTTPADASVVIDEEYVGPLGYVAERGIRLPVGEHRISVTKAGYFPWDTIVVADRAPVKLTVELVPVPD
jgi:hypothetical protein